MPVNLFLVTPPNWLPVDLGRIDDAIREIPAQHAAIDAGLEAPEAELRDLLIQARDASRQVGLRYAAAMVDTVDGNLALASLTLSAPTLADLNQGEPGLAEVDSIAEALRLDQSQSGREISVVEIGGRQAVRAQFTRSPPPDREGNLSTLFVQFFTPLGTESIAVLTFATPTVALAAPLVGLFDAIASTFELEDDQVVAANP